MFLSSLCVQQETALSENIVFSVARLGTYYRPLEDQITADYKDRLRVLVAQFM